MNPRPLLRLEGTAVLAASVFAYHSDHGSWILFALLFLMPDVSMVGYVANAQIGAAVYNAVHTYLGPLLLGAYSVSTDHRTPLLLALIWVPHIGLDRMLGFGLKYPTEFKDIGQAIALALAERGAQVIATDLTLPNETVARIGPPAHAFQLDVTQEENWRSVSLKSRDVGDVDIVVNNAGYFPNRSIDELDLPTWRRTMATNLDAHFLSAKYFLPGMRRKKWGRFVGISSNMIGLAIPGMSHYIATKMGIIGFMRGLANDVASDGITANAVLPGLTNTGAIAPQSDDQKRATWEQQAIKRLGEPQDVTGAVLFLTGFLTA